MAETTEASGPTGGEKTFLQRVLDGIDSVGNKVPHPAIFFLGLIGMLIVADRSIGGVVPKWALSVPVFVWYVFDIPQGPGAPVRG